MIMFLKDLHFFFLKNRNKILFIKKKKLVDMYTF